ncbi:MAG: DUF4982 domain-containing protein [Prevotella sp.]|nr:DUF4982 domain-containing protein [Prevotella sp.]
MKRKILCLALLGVHLVSFAQERVEQNLRDWQFSRDEVNWQSVAVPHDWAISGPFDKKWDLQVVAIEQNGEKEKSEKSGRSGSLPWIGKGFYKTRVHVDKSFAHAELVFDGAMSEPVVYVNGKQAGSWAYGYNAFRIDVTPYIILGDNEVEVRLNNVEESSRWYPGGGLYRPVKLVLAGAVRLDPWQTYFRTLSANEKEAWVSVDAELCGVSNPKDYRLDIVLADGDGNEYKVYSGKPVEGGVVNAVANIPSPRLWSPEHPALYRMEMKLYHGDQLVDACSQRVGIRTLSVDAEHGFRLNGKSRKFQGVCLHHDLGPLGAAVNKAALIRQVRILKDMGCDAIRTSHNMPSTMQMEVYDSLGMMVMAESFDMWIYPKCKNGYARFFKEWSARDMENLVRNHRNHPSLVMWSIGNEIPEQWSQEGVFHARRLQEICHRLDPSRPVTQGMDRVDNALASGFAQSMDVPGFNYRVHKYDGGIQKLPQGFLLGSETASTVSSRGVYKFPVEYSNHKTYDDGQCSSYDVEYCSWSNLPDDDFILQDDRSWTIGQFVWTGFDYLGEPTPYDGYWPSRSSYFGICDLAGLPKDRYYLYRSVWNRDAHTLHLLPHWTWPGREGQTTPVYCYTDYPSAELFVNGKSQGRISKNPSLGELYSERSLDRYRLRWNDVKYEPGELRVVAYDANGVKAGEQVVYTAGKAAAVKLESDRTSLCADGDDLAYITVSLVDKKGNEIPTATDLFEFQVTGAGSYRGACNGDATSLLPFTEPRMSLFSGKLVVTVQAASTPGNLRLVVKDKSNRSLKATLDIPVQ